MVSLVTFSGFCNNLYLTKEIKKKGFTLPGQLVNEGDNSWWHEFETVGTLHPILWKHKVMSPEMGLAFSFFIEFSPLIGTAHI